MTRITVDHVSKYFDLKNSEKQQIKAVDDVTLQIKTGESIAILGPSGSGKTTLLRLIAGLESPDSGAVYYDDMPLSQIAEQERNIGMVFQDYALIPHWDARHTIGFFLRLRRREQEVPAHVHRVSKITGVGLDYLLGRFPKQLSGGEKQRVAIARAFARDLNVLLFDEPFANLDAKFRATARVELRRLLDEFSVTSVFVTHDQMEAASLSDRIILIRSGQIEQLGPYEHLHDDPENLFVANFVGVPRFNFFQGVATNNFWHHPILGTYPLPRPVSDKTTVTIAIRPDSIVIAEEGIQGKIDTVTPFLPERYLLVDVIRDDVTWQLQVPIDTKLSVGETITCQFNEQAMYFFNTQTEARIA